MKILIVSPYLPHPRATHGTGVFMYGLLHHLAQRHRVSLLTFCDHREMSLVDDLRSEPMEVIVVPRAKGRQLHLVENIRLVVVRSYQLVLSVIVWQPYYAVKYRNRRMARVLHQLTSRNRYDVVQIEFAQMGWYRKFIVSGTTVLHDHDVVFRPAYRNYRRTRSPVRKGLLFLEWCRWARYEPRLAHRYDHILTVTDQDTSLLQRLSRSKNISYLPRGVDVPETIPDHESREPKSLLFVGTFSHRPNIDAAQWLVEQIFPLVVKKHPETSLYIIGSKPPAALHVQARNFTGVTILGYVDDVVPWLRRCCVFIAPLRFGGGVKLKIIHAMANGIPVVSTPVGIEGIVGVDSGSVRVGNSADTLAGQICLLFEDQHLGSNLAANAFEIIRKNYSWESSTRRLEEIYAYAASPQQGPVVADSVARPMFHEPPLYRKDSTHDES